MKTNTIKSMTLKSDKKKKKTFGDLILFCSFILLILFFLFGVMQCIKNIVIIHKPNLPKELIQSSNCNN